MLEINEFQMSLESKFGHQHHPRITTIVFLGGPGVRRMTSSKFGFLSNMSLDDKSPWPRFLFFFVLN